MTVIFSKPSCDIVTLRQDDFLQKNEKLIEKCNAGTAQLLATPLRTACPLCTLSVADALGFEHRGAPYLECQKCGHIFSANDASQTPRNTEQYAEVYPPLSDSRRIQRQQEIYEPKLKWVLDTMHDELGILPNVSRTLHWLELGCGEGLFLKALQEQGMQKIYGIDADALMVERASLQVGSEHVGVIQGSPELIQNNVTPDVIAAWFVFEHVFKLDELAKKLKQLPKGTILCFAVPMFSMSSIFDNMFNDLYPRTLDNIVHTQLFSDRSIDYFLQQAGFGLVSQWVFGQDATDLMRCMQSRLTCTMPPKMLHKVMENCNAMIDKIQMVIDKSYFADSRHVVAVRK